MGLTVAALPLAPVRRAEKVADPFYGSPEHREWRRLVIGRAAGRCEKCGRAGVRLFADHVVERRDGGPALDLMNGQALCGSCHTAKTAKARSARYGGGGV